MRLNKLLNILFEQLRKPDITLLVKPEGTITTYRVEYIENVLKYGIGPGNQHCQSLRKVTKKKKKTVFTFKLVKLI